MADRTSNPFPFLALPRELRDQVYYRQLLLCKRQLSCMAVGYNQWPTPKLLRSPDLSDQAQCEIEQTLTYPLRIENFFLVAPYGIAPFRQTYGWSPEKLTNLMCVCRLIQQEVQEVLYRRFTFCFHYGLYPEATTFFCRRQSTEALTNVSVLALVLRFDNGQFDEWKTWEENNKILSNSFSKLRTVSFEIQICGKARKTLDIQAEEDVVGKLISAAHPFLNRSDITVTWVGVAQGRKLAKICQKKISPK